MELVSTWTELITYYLFINPLPVKDSSPDVCVINFVLLLINLSWSPKIEDATVMKQKQDNQISDNNIGGDLNFSPIQNILNGPEDPLSEKSEAEKAVHYNEEGNAKIGINDDDAIKCFLKSINCDNSLPSPHIGLGTIAYRQKKLNTALGHFRKAESLYEKFPTLADQRQKVKEMIQHISEKQKKPWFMRLF
ncbi:MAG: hypothetical protein HEQ29_18145 [Dolichospermum sp. LBC05a]|nr:hypothetical protein [Dolichospermum sp. OL01]MCO5798590.1 hypothetical protein [Dolichospermum sp. OL03]MCS6279297.1 hypothetical protein [Dolichospermum sp.]QSV60022.1 MAG: hypothetical protein HEQ29_18145 [Dolichospermum sp. LBC05a]